MQVTASCVSCLFRQWASLAEKLFGQPETRLKAISLIIEKLAAKGLEGSPPHVAKVGYDVLAGLAGVADPFLDIKCRSNAMALEVLPVAKALVDGSPDRVHAAAACAVAGNIIDYAVNEGVSSAQMIEMIYSTMENLDKKESQLLAADARQASNILYICDNAGEIVFDSLLIRELGPEKITVCVRGEPAINDALAADARAAGLDILLDGRIVNTGEGVPGVNLRPDSAFCSSLRKYDMLIAKGQGNFESLHDAGLRHNYINQEIPVWFLFRVKCGHVARSAGVDNGKPAMIREC